MCAPLTVAGTHGPTVGAVNFYAFSSQIEHRFDAQHHSRFEARAAAGAGVIGDLRRFVKFDSASVSDIIADDG